MKSRGPWWAKRCIVRLVRLVALPAPCPPYPGGDVRIHISNSQTKSAPDLVRALGSARIPLSFSVPRIEGDGAPRWRPGYPGCPVGSGLIETHRSLDAPRASRRAIRGIFGDLPTKRVSDRGRL